MSTPSGKAPLPKPAAAFIPRDRWWGRYVMEGTPPRRRFVVRWGRIGAAAGVLAFAGYLSLATALWAYYRIHRDIPGVSWIDIAVITRFPRVQEAIGAHYLVQAKEGWAAEEYFRAILTARAAVQKAPRNLEARLFLAKCWQDSARFDEAVRALEAGIPYHAKELRFQQALVETCLASQRFDDLLRILRERLPENGADVLRGGDRGFQLAEVRATLESSDAAAAEKVAKSYDGLYELAEASPVMARIELELGRKDEAFRRLKAAREARPEDAAVYETYIEFALKRGDREEAKRASRGFLALYPNLVPAQLRFLESHDPSVPAERQMWVDECVKCLVRYRKVPAAMQRLGNLAASKGWVDLTFLLYQNALQESLNGFPYVVFYLGSVIKAGDYARADRIWQDLSLRNAEQLTSLGFLHAMVAQAAGRRSEAILIVERLRRESAEKPRERQRLAEVFGQFGFPALADEVKRVEPQAEVAAKGAAG